MLVYPDIQPDSSAQVANVARGLGQDACPHTAQTETHNRTHTGRQRQFYTRIPSSNSILLLVLMSACLPESFFICHRHTALPLLGRITNNWRLKLISVISSQSFRTDDWFFKTLYIDCWLSLTFFI